MTILRLTSVEMRRGADCGVNRQIASMQTESEDAYGGDGSNGFQKHIIGAQCELAVAKMLDRYWPGTVNRHGEADIGTDIEVRGTDLPHGQLILHRKNPDDRFYYLVIASGHEFNVVGWIVGEAGKREAFWKEYVPGRPAFFVPQRLLTRCLDGEPVQQPKLRVVQ